MSSVAACIGIKYRSVNGTAPGSCPDAGTVRVRRIAFIPCIAH
ncbi:hypothetical protein NMQ14_03070 [Methyloversatilis sp. XJ19-13]|nr:hypothetical protein [Methyloversatilis sp. XJ19-13]MCQ9373226.1 hypothetical protein [Methyloversatilis sp. XJ19-13]